MGRERPCPNGGRLRIIRHWRGPVVRSGASLGAGEGQSTCGELPGGARRFGADRPPPLPVSQIAFIEVNGVRKSNERIERDGFCRGAAERLASVRARTGDTTCDAGAGKRWRWLRCARSCWRPRYGTVFRLSSTIPAPTCCKASATSSCRSARRYFRCSFCSPVRASASGSWPRFRR